MNFIVIDMSGREVFYSLLSKFPVRHEGFSFHCFRKSDEGGDTDLMYDFCLPNMVDDQ